MKIKTIFSFEYLGYLKNKVFVGFTITILTAILILAFIPNIYAVYQDNNSPQTNKILGKAAFVGDQTIFSKEILAEYLPQYEWEYLNDTSSLKENIERKDLKLAIEIKESGLEGTIYVNGSDFLSNIFGIDKINGPIHSMMVEVTKTAMLQELDDETAVKAMDIVNLDASLNTVSVGKGSMETYWIGYALVLILYMAIILYGQFILISVISEKSSKAMEVLITSAKPVELMFGKVFGVGCAALTQLGLILITSLVAIKLNQAAWDKFSPIAASISIGHIICFFVFFILGFFLYAFIYAALASTTSRMEEANTISLLPVLLSMVGFFIAIFGVADTNSVLVKVFSYIPFSSPMVMFMRFCLGEVSSIEILISIIILAISVYFTGFVSSKIYRLGLLMYGNKPNLKNMIKMIGKA